MFVPFVVKKYFFSKKIRNIINLISGISILSVTIGTASLIIILSVFNGIDSLVQKLMNSFDPDLKIEVKYGKNFPQENIQQQLAKIEGIKDFSFVLEDNALLQYGNRKFVGTVLGIDENFNKVSGIDTMLLDGKFELKNEVDSIYIPQAIVGGGVAYRLSIAINSMRPLQIWIPRAGQKFSLNPSDLFNKSNITPVGVFSVQQDYDIKYVLVPYNFAQNLLEKEHMASAVYVKVKPGYSIADVQNIIITTLGSNYKVSDRFQQHATLYKMMKSEKKMIFIIFIFVLLIASFSGIGSVTMLILDKKRDIFILSAMGSKKAKIRNIFAIDSSLIFIVGATLGVFIGTSIAFIQQQFGIISLPQSGTFIIDAYPVKILAQDVIYIFLSVSLIGFILSWLSSNILVYKLLNGKAAYSK